MVAIAQVVEHLVVVQDVAGSSPVSHPTVLSGASRENTVFHSGLFRFPAIPILPLSRVLLSRTTKPPADHEISWSAASFLIRGHALKGSGRYGLWGGAPSGKKKNDR